MNNKVAKMFRRFKASKAEKRQWKTFSHTLRGLLRMEVKTSKTDANGRPTSWPK